MAIEDSLKKMLRRAAEEASPPDLEQFRERMRNYAQQASPNIEPKAAGWNPVRTWALALVAVSAVTVAAAVLWFVTVEYPAGIAVQQESARAQRIDDLERQFSEARIRRFSERIFEGTQKLRLSLDPTDRERAIWQDLLPVLKEAQQDRDDFINVAIEYRKVLPLLQVNASSPFRESYWGELWIYNILLNSKINPVVEAARQTAPPLNVVEQILREQGTRLPADKRMAFEEAVMVYENTLKTIQ